MQSVEIPEKVQIEIKGNTIETKGSLGTNVRSFNDALIKVTKEQNKVVINPVGTKKLAKKAMMAEVSFAKHIKN
ncbi:MAG: 50S ribosomal protein L6, partial [Candidatus Marsarchaeota archaeon]|nr:50S ribosomal protein L6 [Candidatus Marsarchaeota archaeon]